MTYYKDNVGDLWKVEDNRRAYNIFLERTKRWLGIKPIKIEPSFLERNLKEYECKRISKDELFMELL